MKKQEYYDWLKSYYLGKEYRASKNIYAKKWREHKYKHSLEVVETGLKIIKQEPALSSLPVSVRRQFECALLFHDIARAKEVSLKTGKYLKMNHSIEGARDVLHMGETSLNIIIPIMLHGSIDDDLIGIMNEKTLKKTADFRRLSKKDRQFVLEAREAFYKLGEEGKNIVRLGISLVKDADKAANLIHIENMMGVDKVKKDYKISRNVFKQVKKKGLVDSRHRKTLADYAVSYMAWENDLRFETSIEMLKEQKVLKKTKNFLMDKFAYLEPVKKKRFEKKLDKIIEIIKANKKK